MGSNPEPRFNVLEAGWNHAKTGLQVWIETGCECALRKEHGDLSGIHWPQRFGDRLPNLAGSHQIW